MEQAWYEGFFDDIYIDHLAERMDITATCDYLLSQFGIKPGALIFEQCCGTADISRALAERGYRIIGVDLSSGSIERAKQLSQPVSSRCSYQKADALEFVSHTPVDAAFNWYTSFGYTDSDLINCQMIRNAYTSLKEGGVFVLDYTNPAYILQNFKPYFVVTLKDKQGKITKKAEIDMNRGMFVTHWHYDFPGLKGSGVTKFGESKIYFPSMLKEMFQQAGFKDIKLQGSIKGEAVSKDSPRNIVVGVK